MRYCLQISYDGTNYCGWQIQRGDVTVQSVLEEALSALLGTPVRVTASGRTDAGVHAAAQICHFDAETSIPPERMADALNARLPQDIRVLKSCAVPETFDCNRSAKRKTYAYSVYLSAREHPLLERYAVRIAPDLDGESLLAACSALEGEHDFKAFCASGSSAKTTARTVYRMAVERSSVYGLPVLTFFVTGNGFLYNMVRTIVGTVLAVAQGSRTVEDIDYALATGSRVRLGKTMPAKGLTLISVEYPIRLFE